jgi:hypothetical protein
MKCQLSRVTQVLYDSVYNNLSRHQRYSQEGRKSGTGTFTCPLKYFARLLQERVEIDQEKGAHTQWGRYQVQFFFRKKRRWEANKKRMKTLG